MVTACRVPTLARSRYHGSADRFLRGETVKERFVALAAAGILAAGFIIPAATPAYAGDETGLSTTDATSVATGDATGSSAPASVVATPDPAPSGTADAAAEPVVKLEILKR